MLLSKLIFEKDKFPVGGKKDLVMLCVLDDYMNLLIKHIDLVNRRILKGEIIPHEEKMMSILELTLHWVSVPII